MQAVQSAPPERREPAAQDVQQLQAELAKGKKADDGTVAGLVENLADLVPGAVSAVASAFGSPLLAGVAGPVTSHVLHKLGLRR